MREPNILAGIAVNVLVLLLGVMLFLFLCRWMRKTAVPSPPFLSYFILFATFGGWLMVFFTAWFWVWSAMASLGLFYLAFLAPFVTTWLALALHRRRGTSPFHRSAYFASIGYSALMAILVASYIGWWLTQRT